MPVSPEVQGYGLQCVKHHPPPFDPVAQFDEAFRFYEENGYVVVNQLNNSEIKGLNAVCDEFHAERGSEIDVPGTVWRDGRARLALPCVPCTAPACRGAADA